MRRGEDELAQRGERIRAGRPLGDAANLVLLSEAEILEAALALQG